MIALGAGAVVPWLWSQTSRSDIIARRGSEFLTAEEVLA
jgi:hypothetical protein